MGNNSSHPLKTNRDLPHPPPPQQQGTSLVSPNHTSNTSSRRSSNGMSIRNGSSIKKSKPIDIKRRDGDFPSETIPLKETPIDFPKLSSVGNEDEHITAARSTESHTNENSSFSENTPVEKRSRKSTLILRDEDELKMFPSRDERSLDSGNESLINAETEEQPKDKDFVNINNDEREIEESLKSLSLKDNDQSENPIEKDEDKIQDTDVSNDTSKIETPAEVANKQPEMYPVEITWKQGGDKVYVTGSFTGWRKMISLIPVPDKQGLFHVKLQLPAGTHRFRFIVDNELKFSDFLPTATDQTGNFVNYLEVKPPPPPVPAGQSSDSKSSSERKRRRSSVSSRKSKASEKDGKGGMEPMSARSRIAMEIRNDPDDFGDGYSRFVHEESSTPNFEYTQEIPTVFTDPKVMEEYYLTLDRKKNSNSSSLQWLTPPQLPPHLENIILNSSQDTSNENTSGALPIPNHVVLNHLVTTSIKHNTLCVASIIRYKHKYVTQILYAPLQ